ncbi:MAG: hypothetical protein DRP64_06415, partial [Verrucomicrobia bacterium]
INGDGFDDAVVAQAGYGGQAFFAAHSVANGSDPNRGDFSSASTSVSTLLGTTAGSQGVFLADVNGDGIDDAVNVEGGGFAWSAHHSTAGGLGTTVGSSLGTFGSSAQGDIPLMGDFNGDGFTDVAVYRTSSATEWFINKSTASGLGGGGTILGHDFGFGTDIPFVGDVNGDGRDDAILMRANGNSLSWIAGYSDANGAPGAAGNSGFVNFGLFSQGDVPFVADVNGDGLTDIGVKRGNEYLVAFTGAGGALSSTVGDQFNFGFATDQVLFGDFNVIPEPAAIGMILLGGSVLWIRKHFMV